MLGLRRRAEDALRQARIQLLTRQPFWGVLATSLELREMPEWMRKVARGPMSTDGWHLYYIPEIVLEVPEEQRPGLVAHETGHPAFGHIWRGGKRDPEGWNIATDLAINPLIEESGFPLPEWVLRDDKCRGLCAEEIYERIPKVKIRIGRDGTVKITMPDGKTIRGRLTNHSAWGHGGKKSAGADAKSKRALAEEWKIRLVQAAKVAKLQSKGRGTLPAGLERIIDDLLFPKTPPRLLFQRFMSRYHGGRDDWSRPDRRWLSLGLYLPSRQGLIFNGAFATDTSGSVTDDNYRLLAGWMRLALMGFRRFKVRLIQCDAESQKETVATSLADFDKFRVKRKGDGGTAYLPVFERLKKLPDPPRVLVYLTDGQCPDVPDRAPFDVIWVLTEDGTDEYVKKIGSVIQLGNYGGGDDEG